MKIKLGDRVRLVRDITESSGTKYLKGTIGIVCDDDNPDCPCVELGDSENQYGWSGFKAEDLEIIDLNAIKDEYKIGTQVIAMMERTESTSHGDSTCSQGTKGTIIDNDHFPEVFVEIINTDGEFETFGYSIEELRVIK